mmetsp:Transcript_84180/g.146188  ORF Transcript_84180/g.146188 Transcript_84180/m.146188 type:complete len:395 (+) Transcript_84180:175-1359(+)
MPAFAAAAFVAAIVFAGAPVAASLMLGTDQDSDCNKVVFDQTDEDLHVRTMVVEDSNVDGQRQRSLVLVADDDHSMPCRPQWWLEHNPQGVIHCKASAGKVAGMNLCDAGQCEADAENVELGYVRTMLASSLFVPRSHTMSAVCIELGCRARMTRTRTVGTLLERAPEAQWSPRSHIRRALIIGLGSSTMALWMRHELLDTELHVAELVPGVAAAAPCFGLQVPGNSGRNSSNAGLHLHVGDGRKFLQEEAPDGHFDVIIVDAFDKTASLPACFRTREFFQLARQKLAPGGALSFNLLNTKSALRIVKSLTLSFETSHVWMGQAPGAEGIQEVVTAFAPGRQVNAADSAGGTESALPAAKAWFAAAQYSTLRSDALKAVQPFEDVTECSGRVES